MAGTRIASPLTAVASIVIVTAPAPGLCTNTFSRLLSASGVLARFANLPETFMSRVRGRIMDQLIARAVGSDRGERDDEGEDGTGDDCSPLVQDDFRIRVYADVDLDGLPDSLDDDDDNDVLADSVEKFIQNEYPFEARQALVRSDRGFSSENWGSFAGSRFCCTSLARSSDWRRR